MSLNMPCKSVEAASTSRFNPYTCDNVSLPAEAQSRGVGSSRLPPAVDGLGEFVQQATVTRPHLENVYFLIWALRSSPGSRPTKLT